MVLGIQSCIYLNDDIRKGKYPIRGERGGSSGIVSASKQAAEEEDKGKGREDYVTNNPLRHLFNCIDEVSKQLAITPKSQLIGNRQCKERGIKLTYLFW